MVRYVASIYESIFESIIEIIKFRNEKEKNSPLPLQRDYFGIGESKKYIVQNAGNRFILVLLFRVMSPWRQFKSSIILKITLGLSAWAVTDHQIWCQLTAVKSFGGHEIHRRDCTWPQFIGKIDRCGHRAHSHGHGQFVANRIYNSVTIRKLFQNISSWVSWHICRHHTLEWTMILLTYVPFIAANVQPLIPMQTGPQFLLFHHFAQIFELFH